jgi:hypothetical protein
MTKEDSIRIATLRYLYKKAPLSFCKDMLGVTLSEQQRPLFLDMIEADARVIVKSATGTGKTFLLACVILHQLLTEPSINIMATSPSAGQLQRGLRKELGIVHGLFKDQRVADMFEIQRDAIFLRDTKETNICYLVTGSAENEENLAGVHAKKVIVLIDEASGINDKVMGILKGNLTTAGSSMVQTSNPQRPSGPYYDLFQNPPTGYKMVTLDAYGSPMISKKWIAEQIEFYGEDSDFVRVRILGEFPRASDSLFFQSDQITNAMERNLNPLDYMNMPLIMGVDVARFGSDKSVIVLRQGPKLVDIQLYSGLDTQELSAKVIEYYNRNRGISAIIVDDVGIGAGVVDTLKHKRIPVTPINVGSRPQNTRAYFNLRAEIYDEVKEWLRYADIPQMKAIEAELRSIKYGFNSRSQLQLLSKADMKKSGDPSPDILDALTFTFYYNVNKINRRRSPRGIRKVNNWMT